MFQYVGSLNYSFEFLWTVLQAFVITTTFCGFYLKKKNDITSTTYIFSFDFDILKKFFEKKFTIIFVVVVGFVMNTYAANFLDDYHTVYTLLLFNLFCFLVFFKTFKLLSKRIMMYFGLFIGVQVFNYLYSTFLFGSNRTPQSTAELIFDITHFVLSLILIGVMAYFVGIENQEKKEENNLKEQNTQTN